MSTPDEVDITVGDIELMRARARSYYIETNADKQLPGNRDSLTGDQLNALSWFVAVTDLLKSKGWNSNVVPRLFEPTSETDTEGLE